MNISCLLWSPVEQFDIFGASFYSLGDYAFFSDYVFYILSIVLFFGLWFSISLSVPRIIPVSWQFIVEGLYVLIWIQFVSQYLGEMGRSYFPFLFSLFFFILFGNFFGLVPCGKTPTNYLALTLVLSFSVLLACIMLGFFEQDLLFFSIFVLSLGWLFLILLAGMEMVSYLMRGFSLAISLSANITAGHTLLHVLASFCVNAMGYSCVAVVLIGCLLLFVLSLEFFVALVQAFVFVVLVCLYMNDSLLSSSH